MRFVVACLVALGLIGGAAVIGIDSGAAVAFAQEMPSGQINVDLDTDDSAAWWTNPIWIAIGVVALLAVIALVATASRRGGTTVIKE